MMIKLTVSWIWLMALTLLSAALVNSGWPVERVLILALLMVVLKNQQIVDTFMGLQRAPWFWRGIMQFYTLLIALLVYLLFI
ncbi:MAG: cytochrome C oxidase subunit IV family protein [Hahellaceae bacterium]|nr:cytochrome C oxidase subunit IV family protein [Hahellaceae bacterium]MCP5169731.1 cytochrome C oxidase subunit IV family protein [Hahellaceae bacterium]